MVRVIVRRLLWVIPLLVVVSMLTFLLQTLVPGSVAEFMLSTGATVDKIAELNHQLGYDRSFIVQYGEWLFRALQGNLGTSAYSNESVVSLITARLPVTLSLTAVALLVSVFVGLGVGAISAFWGGIVGRVVEIASIMLMSIPNFWLSLTLVTGVSENVKWIPSSGYSSPQEGIGLWLLSLLLPVTATVVSPIAIIGLNSRGELLTAMRSDFVRALRANGIPAGRIFWRHVLRNALGPILTIISLIFVNLLGGTLIVEQIFALPGMGRLAITATNQHDIPIMQGIVIYYTIIVATVFTLNDLLLAAINPKVDVT